MVYNFADKLTDSIKAKRSYVCAGLDLSAAVAKESIPDFLIQEKINRYSPPSGPDLESVIEGCQEATLEYGKNVLRSVIPHSAIVKIQVAHYEAVGASPSIVRELIRYARQLDPTLVIGTDSKRNDIGSTAKYYADSQIGITQLPLGFSYESIGADFTTVNGYLGRDCIQEFRNYAQEGKGIFVLVDTSNQSKKEFQNLVVVQHPGILDLAIKVLGRPNFTLKELEKECFARTDTPELAHEYTVMRSELEDTPFEPNYVAMGKLVKKWGEGTEGKYGYSAIGAVVGCTYPFEAKVLSQILDNCYKLAPGFKTQGAEAKDIPNFGSLVVVNASRSIDYAIKSEPWKSQFKPEEYYKAAEAEAESMKKSINVEMEKAGLLLWQM